VAYAVHPGVVATEIGRSLNAEAQSFSNVITKALKTPLEGAQTTLHCALDEKLAAQKKKIYYR